MLADNADDFHEGTKTLALRELKNKNNFLIDTQDERRIKSYRIGRLLNPLQKNNDFLKKRRKEHDEKSEKSDG